MIKIEFTYSIAHYIDFIHTLSCQNLIGTLTIGTLFLMGVKNSRETTVNLHSG